MKQEFANVPSARSWKDISQPVRPRAMSRGGRWRLVKSGARTAAFAVLMGGVGWGAWMIFGALQESSNRIPAAAAAVPMKPPVLQTTRDGVLDSAWLARTLELRPGISLMELDLARLRDRLLADPQVLTANLTRHFPDRLQVQISERMPIARIRIQESGVLRDMLVAGDGIVYLGTGYDPAMLNSLPWLDGVALAREGLGFRALADMESVARLLAAAQFSAAHLYRSWQTVSLARLASDRELEITTKQGVTAVFSAKGEFFPQLAKLDYLIERLRRVTTGPARLDLSLGREVPVTIEAVAPAAAPMPAPKSATPRAASSPSFFQLRT